MGRKLYRVPLDFAWPLDKRWEGYVNPYYKLSRKCAACDGSGYAPMAKLFYDQWYGNAPFDPVAYGATPLTIDHPGVLAFAERNVSQSPDFYGRGKDAVWSEARRLWKLWRGQWCHHLIQADVDALVAADRLWDFTRVPRTDEQREIVRLKMAAGENSWLPESNGYTPTADEVNAWSIAGGGHDSSNAWHCVRARCEREGAALTCTPCHGSGEFWPSPEDKRLCEAWTKTEPPTGDGYQLWETTSEGSPQTPVFATMDELCAYAAEHCTTFASHKASAEEWREMLDDDFVHHRDGNNIFM